MGYLGIADGAGSRSIAEAIKRIGSFCGCQDRLGEVCILSKEMYGKGLDFKIIILNGVGSPGDGGFAAEIEQIGAIVNSNTVLIVNADEKHNWDLPAGMALSCITYGFNPKSSVTASSVAENEFRSIQCCLQRAIPTFAGTMLEPQEFCIKTELSEDVHQILAAVTACLLCGADAMKIDSHIFV